MPESSTETTPYKILGQVKVDESGSASFWVEKRELPDKTIVFARWAEIENSRPKHEPTVNSDSQDQELARKQYEKAKYEIAARQNKNQKIISPSPSPKP